MLDIYDQPVDFVPEATLILSSTEAFSTSALTIFIEEEGYFNLSGLNVIF